MRIFANKIAEVVFHHLSYLFRLFFVLCDPFLESYY